jgi:alpha-tubulin suppressor-like RCC1 family protein
MCSECYHPALVLHGSVKSPRCLPVGARANRRSNPFAPGCFQFALTALLMIAVNYSASSQSSRMVAWGYNGYGQTDVPSDLTNAVFVGCGDYHSFAVQADGRLVAWGIHNSGPPAVPVDLTNAISAAGGGAYSVAVKSDGMVEAFGDAELDWLKVPPGLTNAIAVAAGGDHILTLLADGTLRTWGSLYAGSVTNIPPGISNAVAIAAGTSHSVALLADGRIVAWGDNSEGQAQVPSGLTDVIAIAARSYQNLALRSDGSAVAWGTLTDGSTYLPATVPAGVSNLIHISVGCYPVLGLRADGTVVAWGLGSLGATNVPAGLSNAVMVAGGGHHSAALVATNVLYLPNRLPDLAIHAGGTLHLQVSPVASGIPKYQWQCHGTNLPAATNSFLIVPNMQPALAGVYAVTISSASGNVIHDDAQVSVIPLWIIEHPQSQLVYAGGTTTFSARVLGEGLSYQWRFNRSDIAGATQPALVLTNLQLAQSGLYSLVVSNGLGSETSAEARLDVLHVAAWGDNSNGQTNLHPSLTNIAALKAGFYHNLALRQDGTVFAWGNDDGGSTNVPPGLSNIVAIAAGGYHNLALHSNGTVTAWGSGILGWVDVPAGLTNVVAIAAGGDNNLALCADGSVLAWGNSMYGQTLVPAGLSNVVDIACSWYHNLALRADGKVFAWGNNFYGQSTVPVWLTNAVAISAGGGYSVALRADGTLVVWGENSDGQTNAPPSLANVTGISAGDTHALARRADGTLVAWGSTNYNNAPPGDLPPVVDAACGPNHTLALIGSGPPRLICGLPHRTVQAGATAYFRMTATGERPLYYQWRCNGTNLPGATNPWLSIADAQPQHAGLYSVVVSNALGVTTSGEAQLSVAPFFITADLTSQVCYAGGTVTMSVMVEGSGPFHYQWRFNGTPLVAATNAALVLDNTQPEQAGTYSVDVSNDWGEVTSQTMQLDLPWVAMWGRYSEGSYPLPLGLTNFVAISEGANNALALRPDGTVLAWGYNSYGQTNVPAGLTNVVAVAVGGAHSVVLRADGTVTAWGRSDLGELNVPAGLNAVVAISAGGDHTLALRSNGTVTAWGYNYEGQTNVPAGLTNVVAVAGGGGHSLALRADGTVVTWGNSMYGQLAVPAGLSDVVAVSAGSDHSLALRADGTVVAWGYNYNGLVNVPAGLTNVVAIDAAASHSLALRSDGSVVAWGDNYFGQTSVPTGLTNVAAISGGGPASLALVAAGPPFVRTPLADRVMLAGRTSFFHAEASGTRPLTYQWRLNGVALPGATNPILTLTNLLPPQAGLYSVSLSNRYGIAVSEEARLIVPPLEIATQPLSQTQYAGGTVTFDLGLGGPKPFYYQWQAHGTNLPGATNATLELAELRLDQSGPYSVAVSNVWGALVSAAAQLTVLPSRITSQPQSSVNPAGATVTISVSVQGVGPLRYQWQLNGVDVAGATNATLVLSNAQSDQAGAYTVKITNAYGTVTSQPALLEVDSVVVWGLYSTIFAGQSNIVAAAAGELHSLALRRDGTVIASGYYNGWHDYGQTNVPVDLTDAAAISCGSYHSLALRSNGTVVAWGLNDKGQTNVPPGLSNVVAIAGGANHTLALCADGRVIAWGDNSSYQTNIPTGLSNVVDIAAGGSQSLALRADGTLLAWGSSSYNLTGVSNVVAIAAGSGHAIGLRGDGTVAAWGFNWSGQTNVPAGLSNVIAIAAGAGHSLALRADRTVVSWGYNGSGQTNTPAGLTNVAAVAGGGSHSLALLADGAPFLREPIMPRMILAGGRVSFCAAVSGAAPLYYQWRMNGTNLPGATNAMLVLDSLSLRMAGDYSLVASNAFGVLTSPVATLSVPPLQITSPPQTVNTYLGNSVQFGVAAAGTGPFSYQWLFNGGDLPGETNRSLALNQVHLDQTGSYSARVSNAYGVATSPLSRLDVGLVAAWGDNTCGQTNLCGDLGDAKAISASGYTSAALKADGTVRVWGTANPALTNVPAEVLDAKAIAAGWNYLLALLDNSRVVAWGAPYYPQITNVPAGLGNVVSIAASVSHALVLRADGIIITWGDNYYGQLYTPSGLSDVVAVACGEGYSLALQADGRVVAWGANSAGQSTVPDWLTNAVAIASGASHSLALRDDGTVVGWGYNGSGQTNVPPGLSNVVSIAAGFQHSLAVRADGTMITWGDNTGGQTNVPLVVSNVVGAAGGYEHSLALLGNGRPSIRSALRDRSVLGGRRVYFAAEASGGLPLHYQWRLNGTNLPGATNIVLLLTNVLSEQGGQYSVTVGNAWGDVTSAPATLSVIPFLIVNQPASSTEYAGGSTTFNVDLDGTGPFDYQWQFFGTNLPGATDASLTLTNLQLDQTGPYSVLVSNPWGPVASAAGELTVSPFLLTGQPQPRTLTAGGTATFSVSVSGAGTIHYQWRLNGNDLPGATNASLFLGNVQWDQAGAYSVTVTNDYGSATSQAATLRVNLVTAMGYYAPAVPTNLTDVVALSAGSGGHALALRADSTVIAWGNNSAGQANLPASVSNIVAVAAGGSHSLALRSDGTVAAWGSATVPTGLSNVVAIAAGGNHSLALRANGSLAAWGANNYGQSTIPAGLSNVVEVAGGSSHSLALRADGSVAAWGYNNYRQTNVPPGLTNIVAIAAGANHNLALRQGGTVVAWGQNTYGQTNVPSGLSNVVAVAGGNSHSLALKADGTVVGWGNSTYWQINVPIGTSNIVAIACGGDYSLLLGGSGQPFVMTGLADRAAQGLGTAYFRTAASGLRPLKYQWRFNGTNLPDATNAFLALTGLLNPQSGLYSVSVSNVLGPITGPNARLAVGEVAAWGLYWNNSSNLLATAPPGLMGVAAIGSGDDHGVALLTNGTVTAWGNNQYGQAVVPQSLQYRTAAIAAGGKHTLAMLTDGSVIAWGRSNAGQTTVPGGLSNVVAVAAGAEHSLALRDDGTVRAWGSSAQGQTNVPPELAGVVAIAGGGTHSLALRDNGTVVAWGSAGQTNVPPGLANVAAIAAGLQHSLALRSDGKVFAWGVGGQTNVPASLNNVVAITAGQQHSLALRADGAVIAWGANTLGQTNVPAALSNAVAIKAGAAHSLALLGRGQPVITAQPFRTKPAPGGQVELSVAAVGLGALSYQWQRDGVDLPGATNSTLVLNGDAVTGSYRVLVANALGQTTSGESVVTAIPVFELSGGSALAADGFHLRLVGLSGRNPVVIYATTNLSQWWAIHTNPPVVGALAYLDPAATNLPLRFYRAVETDLGLGPLRLAADYDGGGLDLRVTVRGLSGLGPVVLLVSTNLLDWRPLLTNQPVIGEWMVLDPMVTNQPGHFYRAVEQR